MFHDEPGEGLLEPQVPALPLPQVEIAAEVEATC
jgi:hypothetical protein